MDSQNSSVQESYNSQQSEIRARKLEAEFNLANKSKIMEQFMKFSRESIDDILNTSHHSSQYTSTNNDQYTDQEFEQRFLEQKVMSFHESWNEFKGGQLQKNEKNQNEFDNQRKVGDTIITSCPEIAFKNYANVFAEITKNVIGEIQNSDSEEEEENDNSDNQIKNQQFQESENIRQALAEIPLNRSNHYKYSRVEDSMMSDVNKSGQEEMNKHLNDFFTKFSQDLSMDKKNQQQEEAEEENEYFDQPKTMKMNKSKNDINTIEEDFDGENIQSELSTNRIIFGAFTSRKEDQDTSTFRYRKSDNESRSQSRDHSVRKHTPPPNLFKSDNKPVTPSPNRYSKDQSSTSKKKFTNFMMAQSSGGFHPPVNTTKNNQMKYLHLLGNDQHLLDFGSFYYGQQVIVQLKLYNSNQRDSLNVIGVFDTQNEIFELNEIQNNHFTALSNNSNSEIAYKCFYFKENDQDKVSKQITFEIQPNQEIDISVVLSGNFSTGKQMSQILGMINFYYNNEQLKVLMKGCNYYPQLRCMQNPNMKANQIFVNVDKSKVKCKVFFKNTNPIDSQLPQMDFQFGFIDLLQYQQRIGQTQGIPKIEQLSRDIQLQNGLKMKLKKTSLSLKTGQEKYLKIKIRRAEQSQNQQGLTMLIAKLKGTEFIYYFTIETLNKA